MRLIARLLTAALAALALVGSIADGAGGHAHALEERDLAAHTLMEVDQGAGCGQLAHFDHAIQRAHPACPGCKLASTPSNLAAPAVVAASADDSRTLAAGVLACAPRPPVRHSGPARAPPAA